MGCAAERKMSMNAREDKDYRKDTDGENDTSQWLAIGLSLGVLFGIVTDNIGLGMMIGVAIGLWGDSVAEMLTGKKKDEEHHEKKT